MASIPAEHRPRFARLIADAWSDPEVAARYEREPAAVLAEYGIVLDGDSDAPELPPAPGDVAVEDLGVSAGAAMATIGTVSCPGSCIGLS
ncbi:TIGR04351 family putative TOMM peptide [Phytohabitans sp. LJ34]|uniref:TIGR04351 family putative TOMM peptide n=1 Tax=Phytohabitans sp. LJ34 TaxID=3452217 RepID=UPI003F8869E1